MMSCSCTITYNNYNARNVFFGNQLQICFSNLTNNTIIHFIDDRINSEHLHELPWATLIIMESFSIIIGGNFALIHS